MTSASPPPPTEPGAADRTDQQPRPPRNDVLDLGRLRRSVHERRVAGVAAGLARHLDIDPIIVRVALVVLAFFGGSGLLVYAAVWVLAPEEGSDSQPLGLDDRSRGVVLIGAGILATLAFVGDVVGRSWLPWPLIIIGVVVVWFLHRNNAPPQPHHPVAYPTGYPTTYPQTTEGPAAYTSYLPYDPALYARPRHPRKRGPILFWSALAVIATGVGTLGVVDVAAMQVPAAAYPALALALTGAMLVLGAFWGRAGGLILIGLGLGAATLAVTATSTYVDTTLAYAPTTSAEVRDSYDLDGGELILDLSRVEDLDGLAGRDITLTAEVGEVEVIVPPGMDVTAVATADVGEVNLFEDHASGFDINEENFLEGGTTSLRIVIDLGVGQVTVREQ